MNTKPEDLAALGNFLKSTCGLVLCDDVRTLRGLDAIAEKYKFSGMKDLVFSIKQPHNKKILNEIIEALVIGETYWFRDKKIYDALRDQILATCSANTKPRIRIWSAACSSGQEPYSIAMTISEYSTSRAGKFPDFEILATDISTEALDKASAGGYDEALVTRGLPDNYRDSFFTKKDNRWFVNSALRDKIRFKQLNLQDSSYPVGYFDVIFLRNVLYYFTGEMKKTILNKITYALNEGGYLFLGSTESVLGYSTRFEDVSSDGVRFFRLKSAAPKSEGS